MKKKLVLMGNVILLMLLITACGNKSGTNIETTVATQVVEEITIPVTTEEPDLFQDLDEYDIDVEMTDSYVDSTTESGETNLEMTEPSAEMQPVESIPVRETESDAEGEKQNSTQSVNSNANVIEYERYMAMSGAEQIAYMESFGSVEAFFEWLNKAKDEYEAANPIIPIEGDEINIKDGINGK